LKNPTQIDQIVEFKMPRTMSSQIGHFVYLYLGPDTGAPLYVGKGQRQRILAHLIADSDCNPSVSSMSRPSDCPAPPSP